MEKLWNHNQYLIWSFKILLFSCTSKRVWRVFIFRISIFVYVYTFQLLFVCCNYDISRISWSSSSSPDVLTRWTKEFFYVCLCLFFRKFIIFSTDYANLHEYLNKFYGFLHHLNVHITHFQKYQFQGNTHLMYLNMNVLAPFANSTVDLIESGKRKEKRQNINVIHWNMWFTFKLCVYRCVCLSCANMYSLSNVDSDRFDAILEIPSNKFNIIATDLTEQIHSYIFHHFYALKTGLCIFRFKMITQQGWNQRKIVPPYRAWIFE